jgi:rod shape-determining protein MreC
VKLRLNRRIVDWSLAVLFIIIPLAVLRASLRRGEPSVVDEAVLRVTAPLSAGVSWVVGKVGGVWSSYVALVDVEEENVELRAENERLRAELATMARRAYDVEALEELVALERRTPADTLGARVIGAPLSPFFRVLRIRIDRGDRHVAPGMPVITSAGLVGRIDKAYGDHADVVLLSDPASSVEVVLPRTGGRGVLTGLGKSDAYTCKLQWLETDTTPDGKGGAQVGDLVLTSGLGAAFPASISVGKVTRVSPRYDMFQDVEVEPAVDLSRLRAVMVLLAPPPPPDPDGGKPKRSGPAFGGRPY